MKHGLIFDLDGTLVDSLDGLASSLNRALKRSGLPSHSHLAVRGFIGNGARILVQRAVPSGSDETSVDQVEADFKADYALTWPDGTRAYQGVAALLETLQARGHALAVLSNKPHPFTETIVARIFPNVRFDAVLGQRSGIPHKPDPTGALEIAARWDVAPAACIVIGDSTMDIETARSAGMESIAVAWGFQDHAQLIASQPGRIARDLKELSEMLG